MFSLGLTVFMMATTIARVSGIIHHGMVDTVWGPYFTVISAEVGIFMVSATTFRTFFVTRSRSKSYKLKESIKYFFPTSIVAKFGRRKMDSHDDSQYDDPKPKGLLPHDIPRAYITGIRTFIDEQGKTQIKAQNDSTS